MKGRHLTLFFPLQDSINRGISMNNLAETARDLKDAQFIFISPQDMAALKIIDPKKQRVVRLPDPVRDGQQRLNFAATQR